MPIYHTISPVYDEYSRVLILGTFPSPKSRALGFYYGHPQNRFWRVLADILNEALPQETPEKIAFLHRHHIALWDVLSHCDITGADDSSIQLPVANNFSAILQTAPIQAVFTTGSKATVLYQTLCLPQTGLSAHQLPSTSPANCACKLEQLIMAYRAILPYL